MREKKMVDLRFFYSVLVFHLLLLKCDHCHAARDLKEQDKSSSQSHISLLPFYGIDKDKEKTSSSSSYISLIPFYGIGKDQEKTSSLIPFYGIDKDQEKTSSLIPFYGIDKDKEKTSSLIPFYGTGKDQEKTSSLIPFYGIDKDKVKTSSSSSYISLIPFYGIGKDQEKISSLIPFYGTSKDKKKTSSLIPFYGIGKDQKKTSSLITFYGIDKDKKRTFSSSSYISLIPFYGIDKDEDINSSPSRTVRHNMENSEDDDIGSEDIGVFTIDDILAFRVGRKLSTFFSIRNHSLYPGFLPKEVADSFPFSSSEIPKILQFFSISPLSPKAKAVKDTVRKCEIEPTKGETKTCATSLESMLEFVRNAFGPQVDFELVSTSHPTMTTPILQSYTILEPPREIKSPKKVACHPLPYLYAVYMCHYDAFETKIFKVALVGENGDKVDALIVCHMDTSNWSPKHVAFSLLGKKPGIPVCHAFSEGHGVWIQSSTVAEV